MTPERFDLPAIAPQAWKNGAGLTREIAFGGAASTDFDWRISLADVSRDAPFSAFPGIDRCILLLRGAGMRLRTADRASGHPIDHALTTPLAPFRFSGDVALDATLVDGPCSDLNVMTRRGTFRSEVRAERAATELDSGDLTLLLCASGECEVTAHETCTLRPLQALLWREPIARLRFQPLADDAALVAVRLYRSRQP